MAYDFIVDSGHRIAFGDYTEFQFGTGPFSIGCWIDADVVDYGPAAVGFLIGKYSAGTGLQFYLYQSALANGVGSIAITTGVHHVAWVRRSGTSTLYLDGITKSSGADVNNYTKAGAQFTIGTSSDSDAVREFDGRIHDLFAIKGYGLSDAEVIEIARSRRMPDRYNGISFYWPLRGDTTDIWQGNVGSVTGAKLADTKIIVHRPRQRRQPPPFVAAAGATTVGVGLTRSLRLERLKRAA